MYVPEDCSGAPVISAGIQLPPLHSWWEDFILDATPLSLSNTSCDVIARQRQNVKDPCQTQNLLLLFQQELCMAASRIALHGEAQYQQLYSVSAYSMTAKTDVTSLSKGLVSRLSRLMTDLINKLL